MARSTTNKLTAATPAVTPAEVGPRLKTLRLLYGLSQRELARRAGVTNGTISLIEQDRVSPSVSSLKSVLDGFPMSMAEFFTFDPPQRGEVFYPADQLKEIARDKISLRLVGSGRPGLKLQVLHERYEPGSDTGKTMLSHPGEEAGVVAKGSIEVTVAGQTRVLAKGDAYSFDSRLPHRFRNTADIPCEIVSACTPPSF